MDEFDPSCFGDPLAMGVDWKSSKLRYSTHGAFHKLVEVHPDLLELQPGPLRMYAMFLCAAFVALLSIGLARSLLDSHVRVVPELFAVLPFILFMVFVGWLIWHGMGPSFAFDRLAGTYSRPNPARKNLNDPFPSFGSGRLDQIHAVLQIPNIHSGKGRTYVGWSLELLLHDGTRVFLANHCRVRKNREGERLAVFLGVPLWDPDLDFPSELLV